MAIIQLSKIQHRTGANVDLPQLAEGEFGFATDERRLYIGNDANLYPPLGTSTTTQTEILTEVSTLNWSRLGGSANTTLNIEAPVEDGQLLVANSNTWTNAGGTSVLPINLGNIQNLNIGGGLNGYVLTTDGSGNLSWQGSGVVTYAIANVSQDNPALVTTTEDNAILTGLQVTIFGVGGMTQLKTAGASGTNKFYVIKQSNSTFTLYSDSTLLSPVNSAGFSAATPNTGNAVTSFYENGTGNPGGGNKNIQFNDGSGLFGGIGTFTFDKTTANLSLTGNANIIYDVAANNFIGNFTGPIGNTTANTGNFTTITATSTISAAGNVSAGGNVVVAGFISTGSNLTTAGNLSVTGNTKLTGKLSVTGDIVGHLVPDVDITYNLGSPTHRWNDLYLNSNSLVLGNGTISTTATGDFDFSNSNISSLNANLGNLATANFLAGRLTTSSSSQPNITSVGTLTGLTVAGTTNLGPVTNVKISGSTTNYVLTAIDNIGTMSWLPTQYIETPAKGSNQSVQFNNGNIISGSANFLFDKDFDKLTVPNLVVNSSVTGNASVSVTGNISGNRVNANTISVNGAVTASNTVSVAGNLTSNGILTVNNNAAITGNLSITGNLTANFTNVGNLSVFGNINAARLNVFTVNAISNVSGSNILTSGNVSANGNVDANNINATGNVIIQGQANAVRFVANAEVVAGQFIQAAGEAYIGQNVWANGNITSNSNIFTTGNVSAGGNLTVNANELIKGNSNITGNLAAGNITTIGLISANGNINGANITANGFITTTGNITANGAISANGNITTLGTITANALNVGAMSTSGNIGVNNFSVANFVGSSLVPATDLAYDLGSPTKRWKSLYVSANTIFIGNEVITSDANGVGFGQGQFFQPKANINLLSVKVSANLPDVSKVTMGGGTPGAILKTDGNGNLSWGAPTSFVSGASGSNTQVQFNDSNLMAGSANFTFNKVSNTLSVDRFVGNANGLYGIPGSNVTGVVSQALLAYNLVSGPYPNITQVGSLLNLTSIGAVDFSNANTVTATAANLKVPGTGWTEGAALMASTFGQGVASGTLRWAYPFTLVNGNSNVMVDTSGNIRFAANTVPNVVTIANTGLFTSNLTVNAIANLGNVGNVRIAGGLPNQLLRTDGNGNLTWVAPASTSGLSFGGSNVIVDANNVNLSANGVANVLQVTVSGIITSNANISANANIGTLNVGTIANLGAVANVRIAGGNAGFLLQSNGAGGVQWIAPSSTSSLINGNSNVAVDSSSFVRFSVAGTANILQVTSTGITTGLISATGVVTANGFTVVNNGNVTLPGTASTAGKVTWPGTSACSAPQLTTYSGGTRLVLQDSIATSGSAGFAMGIESGNMWFNTDTVSAGFKWYGGITQIATLNNASGFSAVGNITGSNVLTAGVMSSLGNATHGNIITGGIITANGNITGANIIATSVLSTTGNANVGNVNVTANVQAGNLRTTGNISATGNVNGNFFVGNGYYLTGILREPTANIANGTSNINIPVAAGNVIVTANAVSVMTVTSVGANITGTANVTGNANVGNLGTAGNITANYFIGNGALLSGIATSNQLFNGNSNVSIDPSANVRITANGSANIVSYIGNGAYAANANIGAIQPQNTYHRIGNVYISSGGDYGHFSTHAWFTGGMWMGDGAVGGLFQIAGPTFNWYKGSAATNVSYTSLMSLDANGNLLAYGTISSASNITGNANITGANLSATANITAVNTITAGTLSATGNIVSNSYHIIRSFSGATEGAQIVMSFAGSNAAANSIASTWNLDVGPANDFRIFQYNAGGAVSIPFILRQGNNQADFSGNIATAANVNAGNVNATGILTSGGNITTSQFLNGGSMVISGAATIGANANVTGRINVSNGISLANATVNIINWNTPGVAPPTVTAGYSAGTKAVFYDSKASNASALGYTMGIENSTLFFTSDLNFKWYAGTTATSIATLNATTGLSLTGNVAAPYFIGNGALLSGIATSNQLFNGSSNVTIDPSANVRISAAGVANVVRVDGTGAQVTGNLGIGAAPTYKLDVTGPAGVTTFTGTSKLGVVVRGSTTTNDYSGIDFIGAAGTNPTARIAVLSTGSGSFLSFGTSNAYASGVTNNALTIDYGSNVSVTGNLSVGGITTHVGVTKLGIVSNVQITGGSPGQFLRTDGSGGLSWVAAGGTANVAGAPTQVQFNTGGAMDASANFTFDKTTNTLSVTNIINSGNANVAGNLNVTTGNIVAAANISLTGGTTNNKLIFNANGVAAPILNGTSIGTRIILYPITGVTTQTHFAMGIEGSSTWHSVPDNTCFTRWYAGVNQIANLNGVGQFTVGNILSAVGNIVTTANVNAGNLSVTGLITLTGSITTASTISAVGNINTSSTLNAVTLSATGNVQAGNLRTTGLISATGAITTASTITATGAINTASTISATGAITTASTISATGNIVTSGFIQAAGLASSGNMAIPAGNSLLMGTNAGTSAKAIWDAAGAAPPSYNSFSAGTKIVLFPAQTAAPYTPTATDVGYGLGIENSSIWYSTSHATNGWHRWYAGTTQIANLNYQNFTVSSNVSAVGNVNSNNVNTTSNVQAGNLRTTGIVSATGVISTTGGLISAGIISSYGIATLGNVVVPTGGTISAIGNIQGGNVIANGTVTGVTLSASGNVTGFNLTTGGSMSATSNVTGGNIITGGLITATGNIQGGNLTTAGSVTALSHIGNVFTPRNGGIYWPSDGGLDVANITYIRPTGDVGILDFNVQNDADDIIRLNASGGTSVVGNLTVGANIITTANANVGNINVTSSVQAGNLRTTGVISATGNVTASNFITTGTITLGGVISATGSPAAISATGSINTLSTISATGSITTAGSISAVGTISSTGNITTAANISATAGIFAQTISAIGNINSTGNIITNGTICTIGLIVNAGSSANFFSPINSNSAISTSGAVTGISLNTIGNVNASNVVSTGNVNAGTNISAIGNITTNGILSSVGLTKAGTLSVVGISAFTGAVTTTSSISATGTATAGGFTTGGTVNTAGLTATGTVTVNTLSVTGSIVGTALIPATANIGVLNVTGSANIPLGSVIGSDASNNAITWPIGFRGSPIIPVTIPVGGGVIYALGYAGAYAINQGRTLLFSGANAACQIRFDGPILGRQFGLGGEVTIINRGSNIVTANGGYFGGSFFQRANTASLTQDINVSANGYAKFTKIGLGDGPGGQDVWIVSGNF